MTAVLSQDSVPRPAASGPADPREAGRAAYAQSRERSGPATPEQCRAVGEIIAPVWRQMCLQASRERVPHSGEAA